MSYLNNLTQEQRAALTEITVSVRELFDQKKAQFNSALWEQLLPKTKITFQNKVFRTLCDFTGEFECSVEYKNCYFINNVRFYEANFNKQLSFDHCFFDGEILIHDDVQINHFDMIMVSVKRQMYVTGGRFSKAQWTMIDNGILKLNGGIFENLNIGYWGGGAILNELIFDFRKLEGSISVTGHKAKIKRLDLIQFGENVSISFEDIHVNSISIYRNRNEKALRFLNVKANETEQPSEFSIVESYLGKAEFYSIDFSAFKSVKVLDSHLVDCVFVNTKWNNKIEALKGRYVSQTNEEKLVTEKINKLETRAYENTYEKNKLESDPEIISYYEKMREALRQLKYALSKQGDVINEQKFHALEMTTYYKTLNWETNWWTKFIIKFSSIFSDFGQSIGRPIAGLLLIHFFLFSFLILAGVLNHLYFSSNHPTSDGFWLGIYQYFRLINPFRKADDTFQGGFIIVDLMMRIWASYMIYNIIRASRRFIK